MIWLRSALFNIYFISWSLALGAFCLPWFMIAPKAMPHIGKIWASVSIALARVLCGIRYEVRGREHVIDGPVIYAAKHQSAWDTLIFWKLFANPAYVLKRELLFFPFWGWYLWRMKMIAINRSAGASSIKHMLKQSTERLKESRPIIIFPEGTRTKPGAAPNYHPGVVALYGFLKTQVVPVALNSGSYWGKNAFLKKPGTIVIEFLPPIAPGMNKNEFLPMLEQRIETASQKLLYETNPS